MPTWIAARAVPWIWKKVPWKTVWAIALWLGQKGRDRVKDNLTDKEQSDAQDRLGLSSPRCLHAIARLWGRKLY